jgi:transcriptional regulator with XRE-family HTH domain
MVARANPVDVHVGQRVRSRRVMLGMTQDALGKALGLTFQQVQKYERGGNRISAGRLFALSRVLNVPISFFYEDLLADPPSGAMGLSLASGSSHIAASDVMLERETLELVRAYYRITDPRVRRGIGDLMRQLAEPDPNQKRRGRPPKRVSASEPSPQHVNGWSSTTPAL